MKHSRQEYDADDSDGETKKRKKQHPQDTGKEEEDNDPTLRERLRELNEKYRDRAQERREDKLHHETNDKAPNSAESDIDILEELGATKGLNRQVARANQEAYEKTRNETITGTNPQSVAERISSLSQAKRFIVSEQAQPSTELGKNMLRYLRKWLFPLQSSEIQQSSQGMEIQRTLLTLNASPHQACWEPPRIQVYGKERSSEHNGSERLSPADASLTHRMALAFERAQERNRRLYEIQQRSNQQYEQSVEDSDDDIFDVKGDYDPTDHDSSSSVASSEDPSKANQKQTSEKRSFFEDDLVKDSVPNRPDETLKSPVSMKLDVKDLSEDNESVGKPERQRLEGLSNDYLMNDDMDDMGFEDEDEEEAIDKKKKRKHKH